MVIYLILSHASEGLRKDDYNLVSMEVPPERTVHQSYLMSYWNGFYHSDTGSPVYKGRKMTPSVNKEGVSQTLV